MVAANKYQAKPVFWNAITRIVCDSQTMEQYRVNGRLKLPNCIWRFDSRHEFKVYLELMRMYGAEAITRQYRLQVFNEGYCYPNGKFWKVDFMVALKATKTSYMPKIYYVEAKGKTLPDFIANLTALEQYSEIDFERLFLVYPQSVPTNNKVINNLLDTGCGGNILTYPKLKALTQL